MSQATVKSNNGTELVTAVLQGLRAEPTLTQRLGSPPRIYEGEAQAPLFPYLQLERVNTVDQSVSGVRGYEHELQFATAARHDGLREAKGILDAVRSSLERMNFSLSAQRVILVLPTYSDVMRTKNPNVFRGVLRVRIHTEEL